MKRIFFALLIAFTSLFLAHPSQAQGVNRVWLAAAQTTYQPGETFQVTVLADIQTPTSGLNLQLEYDPACIQPGEIRSERLQNFGRADLGGLLDAALTQLGGEPLLGQVTLATIDIEALAACETTLSLAETQLIGSDPNGMGISIPTELGEPLWMNIAPAISIPVISDVSPTPAAAATRTRDTGTPTAIPAGSEPAPASQESQNPLVVLAASLVILAVTVALVVFGLALRLWASYRRAQSSNRGEKKRAGKIEASPAYLPNLAQPQPEDMPTLFEHASLPDSSNLVIRQNGALVNIPLVASPFNIGRVSVNHLRLNYAHVSRVHAQLLQIGSDWYISDNHSRNGTFVNNQRVTQPCPLRPGDEVRLGQQVVMLFQ